MHLLISIDNDGEVSVIEPTSLKHQVDGSQQKEDYIIVAPWQWLVLIIGLILTFLLLRASLANVQY